MRGQVIDFHTHIYPTALARRAMEVVERENDDFDKLPVKENLLNRMREEEIALSVVHHVVTKPTTQADVNRFARESARPNLLPFGGLHPDCGHVLEEIEKLKDGNMAGIKFHPPFQHVHLEDPRYEDMWRHINHLGFPVLIHCGRARVASGYDLWPSGMAKILPLVPDVPVILAHMGGMPAHPEEEKLLKTFPENVFIDTAMSAELQAPEEFARIAEAYGPERVVFGSDFPYGSQKAAIKYILDSKFSEVEKEKMLCGNAARILGISNKSLLSFSGLCS